MGRRGTKLVLPALAALAIAVAWLNRPAQAEEPPARVVSMNLCTDQLAMLLARPGQLHSVHRISADPANSMLAEQAASYRLNSGLAEEIFLMKPDLVIAGTFSTRATVTLLKRLGFRVEEFAPANTFDDIRRDIRRMGQLLGNPAGAEAMIEGFDARLTELKAASPGDQTLALYYPNNYTAGSGTLAGAVIEAAGLRNLGGELGYRGTVRMPLELLVKHRPDLVLGRRLDYGAPAKAHEDFDHPAYRAIAGNGKSLALDGRYWTCGTPLVLEAAARLAAQAEAARQASGDE